MAYLAKLTKGNRTLDLSASPYQVVRTFIPPSANLSFVGSSGTSANRYGGTMKISERATNITVNVPIVITVSGKANVRRARGDLDAFLALGSSRFEPMYFEYRIDNVFTPEPLFGQYGASQRLEIVHAHVPKNTSRFGIQHGYGSRLEISLVCKPFVMGRRQILGTAKGGLTEDRIGAVDGFGKGLSIPEATTNIFDNPFFTNATWNNNWTNGSDVVDEENTDLRFKLFGSSSARLLCNGATNKNFTQSITLAAVAHSISCYAKLPDSSAISSSHLQIFYQGSLQTTTYTDVGNGWYKLTHTSGAGAGADSVGVGLVQDVVIYVDGFQCEASSIATAPVYGEWVGSAWGGTSHVSSTTRTAATLTFPIDSVLSLDEGTIRIVWDVRDTSAVDRYLFEDDNGSFVAQIDNTSQFSFTDGTQTATALASEPSDYDKIILHFVFGGGEGLKIYRDGVEVATDGSYTAPGTKATKLYLGSDNAGGNHSNGIFMEFSTYDVAMTAAQALADYNTLSPLIANATDSRIFPIPFLWTKDGDNVVDNADDSSRDNWAIAGGIPGSFPAETRIDGEILPGWTGYSLWLSNFIMDDIIRPGDVLYGEQQGTVDATASGGEYNQQSVSGFSATTWSTSLDNTDVEALFDKECYLFTRFYDAGSDMTIAFSLTANGTIVSDYLSIVTTTAFELFKTKPLSFVDLAVRIPGSTPGYNSPAFALSVLRTTGTDNARVDFNILMPRPLLQLKPGKTAAGNPEGFSYTSRDNRALSKTAADISIGLLELTGDKIELEPNQYNGLVSLIGDIGSTSTITDTLTLERIYVTPRWGIM